METKGCGLGQRVALWSERAAPTLAGLYLIVLWFDRVAFASRGDRLVGYSDIYLACTVVVLAPAMIGRARTWLRAGSVWVCAAIGAAMVASTLIESNVVPWHEAARFAIQVWIVVLFAVAIRIDHQRVVKAILVAAGLFAAVALVGGLLGATGILAALEPVVLRPAFLVHDSHPLIGNWPRPSGGFSFSAERCGLWATLAIAAFTGWDSTGDRRAWNWAITAAAVAVSTFSIYAATIVMAVPVWVWHRSRDRRVRLWAGAAAILVVLAIQIPVHHGPRLPAQLPCAQVASPIHFVMWTDNDATMCFPRTAGDGTVTTRYALAKMQALALWRSHPVMGAGALAFREQAKESQKSGLTLWNPYFTTHGSYHGILAEQGIVGLALYALLAILVARKLRAGFFRHPAIALGCATFLVCLAAAALDQDVHKERLLWVTVGIIQGLSIAREAP